MSEIGIGISVGTRGTSSARFEEIDDGLWNVYVGPVWLGRFHEAVGRIMIN